MSLFPNEDDKQPRESFLQPRGAPAGPQLGKGIRGEHPYAAPLRLGRQNQPEKKQTKITPTSPDIIRVPGNRRKESDRGQLRTGDALPTRPGPPGASPRTRSRGMRPRTLTAPFPSPPARPAPPRPRAPGAPGAPANPVAPFSPRRPRPRARDAGPPRRDASTAAPPPASLASPASGGRDGSIMASMQVRGVCSIWAGAGASERMRASRRGRCPGRRGAGRARERPGPPVVAPVFGHWEE